MIIFVVDFREVILIKSYMKNLLYRVAYAVPDFYCWLEDPLAEVFSMADAEAALPLLSYLKSFSSKSA